MDQGQLGKIAGKTGEAASSGKLNDTSNAKNAVSPLKPAGGEDTVEITRNAKLLEQAESRLSALPGVDRARVDAVKAQIENGEYEVNAENVARAILKTDRELSDL